jgi:hypothetical protein
MALWEAVRGSGARSVAVFGMAKNAGKTVALNHLAGGAEREGVTLGQTSIGRDGEAWDVLTHRRKPFVRAGAGTLLATARACLEVGTAGLEAVEEAGIPTPLGPVVVARVHRAGRVELAGPSRGEQLRSVVARLLELGAELVLVDGAVDRRSLASPRVTEAAVMATGAVLSERMEEAVRRTAERVRQLTLPGAPAARRSGWTAGKVVVRVGDRTESFPAPDGLKGTSGIRSWIRGSEADILVGGALTEPLLSELIGEHVQVVVRDATCLFVEDALLRRFEGGGGNVTVLDPIRLAAVTVNPVSPEGWSFGARTFFEAVRDALPGVPVFDVVSGFGPARERDGGWAR